MSDGGGESPQRPSSTSTDDSGISQATVIHNPPPGELRISPPPSANKKDKKWVRFEEGQQQNGAQSPTRPEPVGQSSPRDVAQIDVSVQETLAPQPGASDEAGGAPPQFENAKILTSISPENEHCPWVIPAKFNAYKMPKTLISDQLTPVRSDVAGWLYLSQMPVEDYVTSMEMLTNDYRFRLYTALYRRIISMWLIGSFFIMILLLFLNVPPLWRFVIVLIWMFLIAVGVLFCLIVKKWINTGLHHAVRTTNHVLMKYNLLVGVEDYGKLSCHKITIHFMYYRTSECLPRIMQLLSQRDQAMLARTSQTAVPSVAVNMGADSGNPEVFLVERAKSLILKYSQSYVRAVRRGTIKFPTRPAEGVSEFAPLHCTKNHCMCQFLQKHYFERAPRSCFDRMFLIDEPSAPELERSAPPAAMFAHF